MARTRRGKGLAHVGIERRIFKEEYWQGLSAAAKIFYLHLKSRYNGSNNGKIKLPYSAMKNVRGCSNARTISRAVKELEAEGWITREKKGGLIRYDNLYGLTFKYDLYGCKS